MSGSDGPRRDLDLEAELTCPWPKPRRSRLPPAQTYSRLFSHQCRSLCPLAFDEETQRWWGESDLLFRPEGLIVLGAPPGARLTDWTVGTERVLPLGRAGLDLAVLSLMEDEPERAQRWRPSFPVLDIGARMVLTVVDFDGLSIGPTAARPMSLTVTGVAAR